MAETPLLERLTASDLFMLLWDDYGWPNQIGGLAILDGTSLLDRDGHLRIEAVRQRLEPRLHLVPRFRQLLDRPRRGLGWPLWVDAPCFDLADHLRVHPLGAPADQAQLLQACQQLARRRLDPARPLWELWLLPGLPQRRVGAFLKLHHVLADGPAGVAAFGALLDLDADAPTRWRRRGRRPRSRPQVSCWATTCADAASNSVAGGRAWPIRAGPCAGSERPGRRGGKSSPSSAPPGPASTSRSGPTAGWPSSAAAWTSPSRSPTSTRPRSTTWSWPRWPAACASC